MQPASSTAFLALRRSTRIERGESLSNVEPCHHCGFQHQGNVHLFCFSPRDVDLEFVCAASRGDLPMVLALLRGEALSSVVQTEEGNRPRGEDLSSKRPAVNSRDAGKRGKQRLTHVDVRARPRFHRTPTAMHRASAHGCEDVMKALLEARASVDSRSARFATPLHTCANVACAKLLLEAGAQVTDGNYAQHTAIYAARSGVYCKDPGEQVRLVEFLQRWSRDQQPLPPIFVAPVHSGGAHSSKFWPGLSSLEIEHVLQRSASKHVSAVQECEDECAICLAPLLCDRNKDEEENRDLLTLCTEQREADAMRLVHLCCGHIFHETCVVPALRACCRCPYCRQDVRTNLKGLKPSRRHSK